MACTRLATDSAYRVSPRLLGIFRRERLQAYGYALVAFYASLLVAGYLAGDWAVDHAGLPAYTDFSTIWVVGVNALHREVATLYDSAKFIEAQTALLGPVKIEYPNWPYPPTFSLLAAPFGLLPYVYALLTWNVVTLLGLVIVVCLIVRRMPAIALVLASPFTFWNFFAGQNGCVTGSLIGASLLLLERQPVLAGVLVGCLSYKPQLGILFPIALAASGRWRAFASAAVTAVMLVCLSALAFGPAAWEAFPQGFSSQFTVVLEAGGQPNPLADWGRLQTVYGLLRDLSGNAGLAWVGQGVTMVALAIIVWCAWRSEMRFSLKAATLSAAALIATPYAFGYDLAALAIPVAFLAKDQLRYGLLRGEQTVMIALFGVSMVAFFMFMQTPVRATLGSPPVGAILVVALLVLIIRRHAQYNASRVTAPSGTLDMMGEASY